MRIIKSIFKSGKANKKTATKVACFPWIVISDIAQIEECIEASKHNTVVIFKHSTRCGISRAVLKAFEKQTEQLDSTTFYYLNLIKYRAISNEIASYFGVVHQSPQLIILKDGLVVAHNSHYDLLSVTF